MEASGQLYAVVGLGKVHPTTGHDGPEGDYRYEYPFFNLGAKWGGRPTPRPGRFTPGERKPIHIKVDSPPFKAHH